MRALGGATEIGMSVAGQGAAVPRFQFLRLGTPEVLQIENRALQQSGEEAAFCGAEAVDVGEARHRLLEDGGQLVVGDATVVPIQPVLGGAVRRHVIGGLEAERFADVLAGHGRLLHHHLVLPAPQIFEIYDQWFHYDRYQSEQ